MLTQVRPQRASLMARHALVPGLVAGMLPTYSCWVSSRCSPANAPDGLEMHRANYPPLTPLGPNPPTNARGTFCKWGALNKNMHPIRGSIGGLMKEMVHTEIRKRVVLFVFKLIPNPVSKH